MTATLDRPPGSELGTVIGPRERRRLLQADRSRRRLRMAVAVVAVGVIAVGVVAVTLLAGIRLVDSPSPQDAPPAGPATTADAPSQVSGAPAGVSGAPAEEPPEEPADISPAPADERIRVQLLNGVGAPGVADAVGDDLPEDEFRVVVTDNAPEFGVRKTRLLVYDDDAASLAAAERLRDVLGAGTISVSRQPQSVVDVTVIIGRDVHGGS